MVQAQQPIAVGFGPKRREGVAKATLPIDQRPVAVERRPAVRHRRAPIFAPLSSPPGHPTIVNIVCPEPRPITLEGPNNYVDGSQPPSAIYPRTADQAPWEAGRANVA